LLLVEDGRLNVDDANNLGVTPLMMACMAGSQPIVDVLISRNVDVDKTTPQGKTAWNFAKENQLEDIAAILWEKMTETVRQTATALFEPPKPKPRTVGRKLAPQLLAAQQAVIKPKVVPDD